MQSKRHRADTSTRPRLRFLPLGLGWALLRRRRPTPTTAPTPTTPRAGRVPIPGPGRVGGGGAAGAHQRGLPAGRLVPVAGARALLAPSLLLSGSGSLSDSLCACAARCTPRAAHIYTTDL